MKIVADENIPLVDHFFRGYGELLLKPGRSISRDDLFDADILLVRSVTKVDQLLLHDTPVKFVGSATTGEDHIDTDYLAQAGIASYVAKGCNARAVVEYVICTVAALQKQGYVSGSKLRAGVIGVGTIGKLVVKKLKLLGFDVVQYDPLRAENEKDFLNTPLEAFSDLDFISLHTPMSHQGDFPTYHMIEKNFLSRQKPGCVLLNAGRGATISFVDLKQYGQHLIWCLDVWEHEPDIDLEVLKAAMIATPHIAGYSVESKIRGIEMVYQEALRLGVVSGKANDLILDEGTNGNPSAFSVINKNMNWRDIVLKMYDPVVTSTVMKNALLADPSQFDALRKNFPERHEFAYSKLSLFDF